MEPKFNLNRPKISDDEIDKNKDFDNLVKQFKEQSIQRARSDVSFFKNKKANINIFRRIFSSCFSIIFTSNEWNTFVFLISLYAENIIHRCIRYVR